ncbi:MAG: thermonuclease family protein, partial [Promethearchaeota archaeon]
KNMWGDIMAKVKIFWDPTSLTVDSLGKKRFLRATDGDTPYISVSIRMLSIDTPEVHYPGVRKPSKQDANLAQLATWIHEGQAPIRRNLGDYLSPKLATGKAGTLQEEQGEHATTVFKKMLEEKLTRPTGTKRKLFIRAADQHFDMYGRLLAYLAPSYTAKELAAMSRMDRATFNLLMVERGWAASFPIYPSVPSYPDLVLLQRCAKDAIENQRGMWDDPMTLAGYEFRMCVRLAEITKKLVDGEGLSRREKYGWISRYCVDMTTREVFYPQDYFRVQPYNRIFIWPENVADAVAKMNLLPPR